MLTVVQMCCAKCQLTFVRQLINLKVYPCYRNLYLKLAVLKSQIQSKLMTDQYCVGFYDRAPNITGVLNLYTVLFVQNCMRECKKQKY